MTTVTSTTVVTTTSITTTRLRAAAALAAVLGVTVLGGCTTSETCVDWVSYDDDEARAADSDLVADVRVVERDGTEQMFGSEANAWTVEVEDVLSPLGDAEIRDGDRLRVVATPVTCSEESYPDGDPLDVDGVVRVYLTDADASGTDGIADGSWSLITPYDGVDPVDD